MSTAATHIETEKRSAEPSRSKLVPELRFKEFENVWDLIKLNDIMNLLTDFEANGSFAGVKENVTIHEEKEYAWYVRTTDLEKKSSLDEVKYVDEHSYKFLKKTPLFGDELLVAKRGEIGKVYYYKKSEHPYATLAPNLYLLKLNELAEPYFIYSYFIGYKGNKTLKRINASSTIGALYKDDVKALKLNLPSLPEQQKIASFLSAVDEKIQQLTKKKALLEQYKKGVMQQLFSGHLRFKDENGKSYPDWDWVGGNELFDNISDKKHNSDLPILAITQDQGAIPRELINYQMTVTEASVASYKVVQKGDFIISLRTFQGGIEFSDYHGICSPAYNILRPSSEEVDTTFYKFYLKTSFYIRQLQKNLEGIRDGKMISYKYFSEIKIPFPSHPEQQKIATYLSSIDIKIEAVNTQITKTQSFKKGLLQQMFV